MKRSDRVHNVKQLQPVPLAQSLVAEHRTSMEMNIC
jgi:hypothetical protein